MSEKLLVKPEKCTGCRTCELICSYKRMADFSPGNSAILVKFDDEEAKAELDVCVQCPEAPCIDACPFEALARTAAGTVLCDEEKCTVCGACAEACPHEGISFRGSSGKLVKCDLCGGDPGCAKFCPAGALVYGKEEAA